MASTILLLGLCCPQRGLRHLIMGVSGAETGIPTDLEALCREGLLRHLRSGLVLAEV